jgi:hypothetical protein
MLGDQHVTPLVSVENRHRPDAHQRLGLLSGHHAKKMLGVLVAILRLDRIAAQKRGLCQRQITLVLSFGASHTVGATALDGVSGRMKTRPGPRAVGALARISMEATLH